MAMSVRVRIDEAGQEQAVGGIDHAGSCRRLKARRPDLADRVARHQNVGWLRGVAPDVENSAATDDGMTDLCRHRLIFPKRRTPSTPIGAASPAVFEAWRGLRHRYSGTLGPALQGAPSSALQAACLADVLKDRWQLCLNARAFFAR